MTDTAPPAASLVEDVRRMLVGGRLVWIGRSVDMGDIQFEHYDGRRVALHLSCPFAFTVAGKVLVGTDDIRRQRGEEFDPYLSADSRYDALASSMNELLREASTVALGVDVGEDGRLSITLSGGLELRTAPEEDPAERTYRMFDAEEDWRVFDRDVDGPHLVYPEE